MFTVLLVSMITVSDGRHCRWSMIVMIMVVVVARAHTKMSADGHFFSPVMA